MAKASILTRVDKQHVNTRNSTEVFDTVSVFCDCKQTI